ncbi:PKD domain-containing protein, partial [Flavihumibacter sediminis]|nr:PKD domain-containing protein [Flavihumibacter sediminis]
MRLLTQTFGMPMFTLVNYAASFKKSLYLFLTSFLIFCWGIAVGQSPCNVKPNDNCTSGDITIQSVVLVDANGDPLTSDCTPGTDVTAYLKVNFNVTSNERYGFLITGRVYINGVHEQVIDECYAQTFSSGPKSVILFNDPVTWTCGATIELLDVFTAWDNNAPAIVNGSPVYAVCTYYNSTTRTYNCASLTPKCFYYPTPIKVVGPLIANFEWDGTCNTGDIAETISFTNLTTGGTTPYTYSWNFGDGSPTSSLPNPTHTYSSAGNYTVTLTAYDASNPTKQDVQSYVVPVASCCIAPSITTQPTNKTVCTNATTTFTVAHSGGFPAPDIQWQVSINNGTSFSNLSNTGIYSGTTTTTLTLTGVSNIQNGYLYRAVLTSGSCSPVNSDPASLTVDPATVGGTLTADNTVCEGSNSGELSLTGQTGTIQRWESSPTGDAPWTEIVHTDATYTSGALSADTWFRVIVQSGVCEEAASNAVKITVDPTSVGGTLTADNTVCEGS